MVQLAAFAVLPEQQRQALAPDQLEWLAEPGEVPGLTLETSSGAVRATEAGKGELRIRVRYQDQISNQVVVTATESQPATLEFAPTRNVLLLDESGRFEVRIAEDTASARPLDQQQLTFESSAPGVLAVDASSGAFRALAVGDAEVTAKHPAASQAVTLKVKVVPADAVQLVIRPANIQLAVGTRQDLELRLVAADHP